MIKNLLHRLWHDEQGFVNSAELILIAVLAVIGLIVGLATLRDGVTQELADTGAAIGQVNQSYAVRVTDGTNNNPLVGPVVNELPNGVVRVRRDFTNGMGDVVVSTRGRFRNFQYNDRTDIGDGQDTANQPPPGITVFDVPSQESN